MESLDSDPEKYMLEAYYKLTTTIGNHIPALISQVYLYYDPLTLKKRGWKVFEHQKMDFMMLFSKATRVVIEIDGKQHYAKDNTKVLNWFNTIPIAVAFFAGSLWPNKIREDCRSYMDSIISVSELLFRLDIDDEYENCPQYLKQVYIRDLENAYDYFKYMPHIYRNKR